MIDLAELRAYVATMRELGVKRARLGAEVEIELFAPVLPRRPADASERPVSGAREDGAETGLQERITRYLAEQGGTWVGSRTSLKQALGINNRDHALLRSALEALLTSGRLTEQRARKGQTKQATYTLINQAGPAQSQVSGLLSHAPETGGSPLLPDLHAPAHEPSAALPVPPASASTASAPTAPSAGPPLPAPLPVASMAEEEDYVLKMWGPVWLGHMGTLLEAVFTKARDLPPDMLVELTDLRGQVRDWRTNGLRGLAEVEAAADATLKVCASWFAAGYLEHDVLKDPTHEIPVRELGPATRKIRRDAAVKALPERRAFLAMVNRPNQPSAIASAFAAGEIDSAEANRRYAETIAPTPVKAHGWKSKGRKGKGKAAGPDVTQVSQREVTPSDVELEPLAMPPHTDAVAGARVVVGGDDPRLKRALAAAAKLSGKPSEGGRSS